MSKKRYPSKPFRYGKYVVEYRSEPKSPTHFLKEELNTEDEAKEAADRLKEQGYNKVVIKRVG